MRILQTRLFTNSSKRLHVNQKMAMDKAVRHIASNPDVGEPKVADLAGVRVHKFRMVGKMVLLAYEWREVEDTIILLAIGPHENFYRDIKKTFDS
ncbi:MAG: type II toxin-antitoxin system RelE/ParE family toxin [Magnetococcales bacterium]|nr:type II toxin-antitoxin system RelE/ParE family toxin [Magnetococcales bacterium]